jgi:hypothetical protein
MCGTTGGFSDGSYVTRARTAGFPSKLLKEDTQKCKRMLNTLLSRTKIILEANKWHSLFTARTYDYNALPRLPRMTIALPLKLA